jgi:hypothetical protein
MAEGNFNLRSDDGSLRKAQGSLLLPRLVPMELIVEASPRRVYANAHTYHINSISVNPDQVGGGGLLRRRIALLDSAEGISFRKRSYLQTTSESTSGTTRSPTRATVSRSIYLYFLLVA